MLQLEKSEIYEVLDKYFGEFYPEDILDRYAGIYECLCTSLQLGVSVFEEDIKKSIGLYEYLEQAISIHRFLELTPYRRDNLIGFDDYSFYLGNRINSIYDAPCCTSSPCVLKEINYHKSRIGFKKHRSEDYLYGNVKFDVYVNMVGVSSHDADSFVVTAPFIKSLYPNALYDCVVRECVYEGVDNDGNIHTHRMFQLASYKIVKLTVKSFIKERVVSTKSGGSFTYKMIVVKVGDKCLYYDPVFGKTDGSKTIEGLCKGVANLTPNFNKPRVIKRILSLYDEIQKEN